MAYVGLFERLTRQLAAKGVPDARNEAIKILRERKHMKKNSTELTLAGKVRSAMGPARRAIDRAAKRSGHAKRAYKFVRNRAILK